MDYSTREKLKAAFRPIAIDASFPMDVRVYAAAQIMRALYERSAEAYGLGHPIDLIYYSMLLNQGADKLKFPEDVYEKLVEDYGKLPGISHGTYYRG